jgi:hypothetical protein
MPSIAKGGFGPSHRGLNLLIKAVIAMARDIATAVDSAGLLPQAEEALAQVEE